MINPFKSKKGLGRGLSSLIGDTDLKSSGNTISISSIIPNKNQPRKFFEKESLRDLTSSIKERGVIQPLIVRKSDDLDDKYEKLQAKEGGKHPKLLAYMKCLQSLLKPTI